jgi:hypothetical protein
MSKREAWEFRTNGIRSSGDTFSNYGDAVSRMFKALNALHFEAPEDRDHNGRKEAELIAVYDRVKRERPYVDLSVKALRHGKIWSMQVNRLPWGSSPSSCRGV